MFNGATLNCCKIIRGNEYLSFFLKSLEKSQIVIDQQIELEVFLMGNRRTFTRLKYCIFSTQTESRNRHARVLLNTIFS